MSSNLRTLTANGYWMIPVAQRAAVDHWIRKRGLEPSDVMAFTVDGSHALITVVDRDEAGKPYARGDEAASRQVKVNAGRVPTLDRWL